MPQILKSTMFKSNARLQNAASDHRYHVKSGDRGNHVSIIQFFLVSAGVYDLLDSEALPDARGMIATELADEMDRDYYGPMTCTLVFLYKDSKKLIDKQRQATADDIVGCMTIRSMDDDQRWIERNPAPVEKRQAYAAKAAPRFKPMIVAGSWGFADRHGAKRG